MSYWRGTAVLKLSLLTLEQKRHVGRGTAVPGEVALFYSVFSAYWQRCTCLVSGVCSELLGTTESSCAIVRSVVQLAVSLGKTTTAEGVETKEHLERVRAAGCTEGLLYQPTETFLGHCGAAAYARREVGKCCIADRRNVSDAPSPHCGS